MPFTSRGGGASRLSTLVVGVAGVALTTGLGSAAAGIPTPVPKPVPTAQATGPAITPLAPIKHVVILYQENHTFDNVLGQLCVQDHRCDGATSAKLADGSSYDLKKASDVVPNISHSTGSQLKAIDGGKMDGFEHVPGCAVPALACLTQFDPSQIPNLAALARKYTVSDRTFQMDRVLSWGAHLELVTTDLDGFSGQIPVAAPYAPATDKRNWGCKSDKLTGWRPAPTSKEQQVPPCVPNPDGTGTFWDTYGPGGHPQHSPVTSVPTILDELNQAGQSWRMYVTEAGFDICSYVAKCHDSPQQTSNVVPTRQVLDDAAAGRLPAVSIVLPNGPSGNTSQHNNNSMALGDNWIGDVVAGLQKSPEWSSTAVFITYDDCGCFYDHVPPPAPWGMRVPLVVVSPYAKAGFTDSTPTSFVGMITFIEHLFGLPALTAADRDSYDYAGSFDFSQSPIPAAFQASTAKIGPTEAAQLAAEPWNPGDDPT